VIQLGQKLGSAGVWAALGSAAAGWRGGTRRRAAFRPWIGSRRLYSSRKRKRLGYGCSPRCRMVGEAVQRARRRRPAAKVGRSSWTGWCGAPPGVWAPRVDSRRPCDGATRSGRSVKAGVEEKCGGGATHRRAGAWCGGVMWRRWDVGGSCGVASWGAEGRLGCLKETIRVLGVRATNGKPVRNAAGIGAARG
jgi:hypothetical protein